MNKYMEEAIGEAKMGILAGEGGPFGSVVVKDGAIVGRGHNQVIALHDPTCHGEMQAIRDASKHLGTFDLTGCTLYTTGEPCHMCLVACMWARLDKVYYGCTVADNEEIGFRDNALEQIFGGRDKLGGFLVPAERKACLELFGMYKNLKNIPPPDSVP